MRKMTFLIAIICSLCINAQDQIREGFDSETFPPEGWEARMPRNIKFKQYNYGGQENGKDSYAKFTTRDFENKTGSGWLFTPKITIEKGKTYEYSYYIKTDTYEGSTYKFAYGNAQSAKVQTNVLVDETKENLKLEEWTEVKGSFIAETSGDVYFSFQSFWTSEFSVDTILIREKPACEAPGIPVISDISKKTAVATWESTATNTTGYKIRVLDEFSGVTGMAVFEQVVTGKSVTITGLAPSSLYDVYVQANCKGRDGNSEWTKKVSFTTSCGELDDFSENFDNIQSNNFPKCWAKIVEADSPYADIVTGDKNISFEYFDSKLTDKFMLITPKLNTLTKNAKYRFRFKVKAHDFCSDCSNETVEVGTITDFTDKNTYTKFKEFSFSTDQKEIVVNFEEYSGSDKYIVISRSSDKNAAMEIDDIIWEPIPMDPPGCPRLVSPTNRDLLDVENVELKWKKNVDAKEYLVKVGTTLAGEDILPLTSVGDVESYILPKKLIYNTKYYITVLAKNDYGQSELCMSNEFTTISNPHYGGGPFSPVYDGYYFANSTEGAKEAKNRPTYAWVDPVANNHTAITDWTKVAIYNKHSKSYTIQDIPFDFTFFGKEYTKGKIHVNSNGAIFFGEEGNTEQSYSQTIPADRGGLTNYIAGAFADYSFKEGESKIYHHAVGDKYIVTWYKMYNNTQNRDFKDEHITFQIILHKNSDILVQFNDELSNADENADKRDNIAILKASLVGIINEDGTKGISYRNGGRPGPMFGSPLALIFTKSEETLSIEAPLTLNEDAVLLYPNPVKDKLTISGKNKVKNVYIFDVTGKEVLRAANTNIVNLSKLKNGVYFVKIKTTTGMKSVKVIKE